MHVTIDKVHDCFVTHASGFFSDSYVRARRHFRDAAIALGREVETHVLPDYRGIDGEELATDVTLIGAPDAEKLLIVSSATHGVEGYCGSGCQISVLQDPDLLERARSADVAVLLIHAISPHGFSYSRRVNENNVDVNRNFRDFSKPLPGGEDYRALEPYLLPAQWPPTEGDETALAELGAAMGTGRYGSAVGGGQYVSPDGMYFGGTSETWSNRTVRTILRRYGGAARHIGWIDVHTGLGPAGHCEKVFIASPEQYDRARSWWGADVYSTDLGDSVLYAIEGPLLGILEEECPQAVATTIALENGTVPYDEMVMSLRGDHWLHANPPAQEDAATLAIRQRLKTAFYLNDPEWKAAVLAQFRVAMLQALEGLKRA